MTTIWALKEPTGEIIIFPATDSAVLPIFRSRKAARVYLRNERLMWPGSLDYWAGVRPVKVEIREVEG